MLSKALAKKKIFFNMNGGKVLKKIGQNFLRSNVCF